MAATEKRFDIVIQSKHQLAKQGLDIVNSGLGTLGREAAAAQSALASITEFRRLKEDSVKTEAAWKDATAEVARLATALKQTEAPTRAQVREFESAKSAAGKLKDAYQSQQTELEQMRRKLGEAGVSTTDLSGGMGRLKDQLSRITEFRRIEEETGKVETAWKEAAAEVDRLGEAIRKTSAPTAEQVREFTDARAAADKLQETYQANQAQLETLRREFDAAGSSTGGLTSNMGRLKAEMEKGAATAKTFGADLAAASRSLDVRPTALVRREVDLLRADYKKLAESGMLSQKELAQAATNLKKKIADARAEKSALNKEMEKGGSIAGGLSGQIKNLLGAYLGFQAVTRLFRAVTDAAREAETAQYGLTASVQAAAREFQGTGSLDHWQQKVKSLSAELRIYSESAIANAVSRTVDMTKRLGLSADQMETLIRRTADLSAGKTSLEGGIERVTAALRGEAEASEYLGLTLNETYIQSWYAAHDATGKAWKSLTDVEKAQVRYNVLLAQSDAMQGRAAASANTFNGALDLITAQVTNVIANNEELGDAMARVAAIISDNADEIAHLAAMLTSAVGSIIEFAAENGRLLAGLVGSGGLIFTLGKLAGAIVSVKRAVEQVSGVKVPPILGGGGALNAALLARLGLYGALAATIGTTISAYLSMREAQDEAAAAEARYRQSVATAQGIVDAANASTGLHIKSIEELNRLLREGAVVRDQVTGQYLTAAQAQDKATAAGQRAVEVERQREKTFRELQEQTAALVAKYGELDIAAINAADKQRILDEAARGVATSLDGARQRAANAADAYYDAAVAMERLTQGTDEYGQALERSQKAQADYLSAVEALRRAQMEAARQQYYNEEADLRLSLARRLQEIRHLADMDVLSRREAGLRKQQAERDFSAAVLKIRQAEAEKAKEIYGEDSQAYIEARRAAGAAELYLKDAVEQVTAALVDLENASRRAGDAGEDAGRRGRRAMDEWTEGARQAREETEKLTASQEKAASDQRAKGFYGAWDGITQQINSLSTVAELEEWGEKHRKFLWDMSHGGLWMTSALKRHGLETFLRRSNELHEAERQATQRAAVPADQGGKKTMTLRFQGPNGQTVSGEFSEADAGRLIDLLRQAGMSMI